MSESVPRSVTSWRSASLSQAALAAQSLAAGSPAKRAGVAGASAALAGGQAKRERPALAVDDGVDLGGAAAT